MGVSLDTVFGQDEAVTDSTKPDSEATTSAPDEELTRMQLEASSAFEELESDPIDRSEVISEMVKDFAWWCIRVLIILATSWGAWWLLTKFWKGILPLVLALLVASVLTPATRKLRQFGIPPALAAAVVLLGSAATLTGILALIAPSVIRQSQTLYLQTLEAVQRFQLWLQSPPVNLREKDLSEAFQSAVQWLQEQSGQIADGLFQGLGAATSMMVTLVVVLVLTFFFLKDGDRFLPWMRGFLGRRAGWHMTELLTRIWNTLSGYIRIQAIVSFIDAFFIGIGLVVVGVPMALALAVVTFIAGFIPIVGAFVAGTLAVVVALVSLGLKQAIIVLVIVLAVQQLEGNVLQPMLQSKAMNLHPVVVLISVTLGGSLFKIVGAFLAVPFAATVAVVLRYLSDIIALRAGEKRAEDIAFVTQQGSITAKQTEEAARQARARKLTLPLSFHGDSTDGRKLPTFPMRNVISETPNFIAQLFDSRRKK